MAAQLQRQVLAILAADVVGYSRQMEADEAGTIARLRAVRAETVDPLIAWHRGRLREADGRRRPGRLRERGQRGPVRGRIRRYLLAGRAQRRTTRARPARAPDRRRSRRRRPGRRRSLRRRRERGRAPGAALRPGRGDGVRHGLRPAPRQARPRPRLRGRAAWSRTSPGPSAPTASASTGFAGGAGRVPGTSPATLPSRRSCSWPPRPSSAGGCGRGRPPPRAGPLSRCCQLTITAATGRLADGITDELARFRDLDVIARNSTTAEKGKPVDVGICPAAAGRSPTLPARPASTAPRDPAPASRQPGAGSQAGTSSLAPASGIAISRLRV